MEYGLHRSDEPFHIDSPQRVASSKRRELGDKTDLVRVDVADAADLALVEQEGLERDMATVEALKKCCCGDLVDEWVEAECV